MLMLLRPEGENPAVCQISSTSLLRKTSAYFTHIETCVDFKTSSYEVQTFNMFREKMSPLNKLNSLRYNKL